MQAVFYIVDKLSSNCPQYFAGFLLLFAANSAIEDKLLGKIKGSIQEMIIGIKVEKVEVKNLLLGHFLVSQKQGGKLRFQRIA